MGASTTLACPETSSTGHSAVDTTVPVARVVVVIPCYGQAEFLPDTVASVCAQTFRELEIVIVDDQSPDDAAAVAERLIDAHPNRPIRLVRQRNQGLGASRNNGIAASTAEYVVPLDADDLIGPTFVEDTVRALDTRPDASIAFPSLQLFGEVNEFHVAPEYDFVELVRGNTFTCTALFRRAAWEEVGGYDRRLTAYEDWDFWLRCGERGHLGISVARPVFYYRKRAGSMLARAHDRDKELKAQVVHNHPMLYSPEETAWADGILSGDPLAMSIPNSPGRVPQLGARRVHPRRAGGAIDGARGFTVLSLAEELIAAPDLLASYGATFTGADDATLVICGTDEQLERISALVEELHLDGSDAADLIGQPVLDSDTGAMWASTKVDAMLTQHSRVLPVPLPRIGIAQLTQMQQARRRTPPGC